MYDENFLEFIKKQKVVPLLLLHKGTKIPIHKGWPYMNLSKIPKKEDLQEYNLGIKLNNLAVIDVDTPIELNFDTALVESSKGHKHYYFKRPDWLHNSIVGDKIAIYTGSKRHMVIPPSVHKSGHIYKWINSKKLKNLPVLKKEIINLLFS